MRAAIPKAMGGAGEARAHPPEGDSDSDGEPEHGPDKVLPFAYGVPEQWYFPQVGWPIMLRCEYETHLAFRYAPA